MQFLMPRIYYQLIIHMRDILKYFITSEKYFFLIESVGEAFM